MNITKILWITFAFILIAMVLGFSVQQLGGTQSGIISRTKQMENY